MRSELFLKAILDNSLDGIVFIAPDHKVMGFNSLWQDILFDFFNRIIKPGDDYRDFVLEEIYPLYMDSFEKALQGEFVERSIETVKENISYWYEYKMSPVYQSSGELIAVTLSARNINKEKEADLEREKLAVTLDALIENTTDSIVLLDTEYKILKINQTATNNLKERINKTPKIGDDFREYLYKGREDSFHEFYKKALAGESSSSEIMTQDYQGNVFWFQTRVNPFFSKDKKLIGVSIFANHITENKLAEIALKENESKFRSIFNSSPIPILIADENMMVSEVNKAFLLLFEFKASEIIGNPVKIILSERFQFPTYNQDETHRNNLISFKTTTTNHIPAITKSGEEIIVNISYSYFLLDNKKYIMAMIQDVTKAVADEILINDQLKKLKEIAWMQSHTIRAPVARILGIMKILKSEFPLTEEEKDIWLNRLNDSTEELDSVIKDIVKLTYNTEENKEVLESNSIANFLNK